MLKTFTLADAQHMLQFREMYLIFWKDWTLYTEVTTEALQFLVQHTNCITLPNVMTLTEEQRNLLKDFEGEVEIGALKKEI